MAAITEVGDSPFEVILCEGQVGKSIISAQSRIFLNRKVKDSDNIPKFQKESEQTQVTGSKLGEWLATGICGNNITSSALYVVALCAAPAGKYAPIALAVIAGLLYLFRRIYEEVVTALPVNGGTYNLLLNTTTKANASIAACLTMLSYVVTAVISGVSAMRYVHSLCDGGCIALGNDTSTSVILTTLITLSFAGFLSIMGISESAVVALIIFLFHMTSMFLLVAFSLYTAITNMPTMAVLGIGEAGGALSAYPSTYNYSLPSEFLPVDASSCDCVNQTLFDVVNSGANALTTEVPMLIYNWVYTTPAMGIGGAIFFGYSSALLGISGFESSSNYVENQQPGVFPKTLRNMWIAVTFINPSIALLAQCILPVDIIAGQAEEGALLSLMAEKAAGEWLKVWIVIDATLVLVGAVITGFVGFTGLVHRMTVDRCLPQRFLTTNECRKTRHVIIGFYWFLTSTLVLYTWGNIEVLAGVYTVAFLSVMFSFTVGNMLLKLRRSTLPTPVHVEWSIVMLANVCVAAGLIGNIISRPRSLPSLLIFGAVFILPVQIMLNRVRVLQIIRAVTVGTAVTTAFSSPIIRPSNNPNTPGPLDLGKNAASSTIELTEQKNKDESKTGGGGGGVTLTQEQEQEETKTTPPHVEGTETEKETETTTTSSISVALQDSESTTPSSSRPSSPAPGGMKHKRNGSSSSSSSLLKRSVSDATRLDRVFLECVKSVRELLDSDRATLWLIDHHNGVLWSKVAEGIPHIKVPMDKGIVGWVCTNGKTLNIPDAYKDERFNPDVDKMSGYKTSTILCAPILVEMDEKDKDKGDKGDKATKMVGLIQVINKNGPDGVSFTQDEIHALEDFCHSISSSVDLVQKEDLTGDVLVNTVAFLRKQMASVRAQSKINGNNGNSDKEQMQSSIQVDDDEIFEVIHPRRSLCCSIPCCRCCSEAVDDVHDWSGSQILHLTKKPIIYFTKDDSPEELNTAIRYMLSNEQRRWIKFVRVFPNEESLPSEIPGVYKFLEFSYPELIIEYVTMIGEFGPKAIRTLSYYTHVPTTFMFMGSFGENFNFSFTELGGLRLITDNFVSTSAPTEISMNKVNKKTLLETQVSKDGGKHDEDDDDDDEESDDDIIVITRSSSARSWASSMDSNKNSKSSKKSASMTRNEAKVCLQELSGIPSVKSSTKAAAAAAVTEETKVEIGGAEPEPEQEVATELEETLNE